MRGQGGQRSITAAGISAASGSSRTLRVLDLSNSALEENALMSIVFFFKKLVRLDLTNCANLRTVPEGIGRLTSLVDLALPGCKRVATLPATFKGLKKLRKLRLGDYSDAQVGARAQSAPWAVRRLTCLRAAAGHSL